MGTLHGPFVIAVQLHRGSSAMAVTNGSPEAGHFSGQLVWPAPRNTSLKVEPARQCLWSL